MDQRLRALAQRLGVFGLRKLLKARSDGVAGVRRPPMPVGRRDLVHRRAAGQET